MPAGTPFRLTTPGRSPWVLFSPTKDPFSLSANYGAQASDRRNLFNAAYSFDLGTLVHSNPLVNGVANGWQLSGITQLESGANLTYGGNISNQTPNLNYNVSLELRSDGGGNGRRYRAAAVGRDHSRLDQPGEPDGYRHQQPINPGNQLPNVEPAGYLRNAHPGHPGSHSL